GDGRGKAEAGLEAAGRARVDPRRGISAGGEPLDARVELAFVIAAVGPLQRAVLVVAPVLAELARQLSVHGHARGVQPVIDLGLLAHGVDPRERGPAGARAGRGGVERDHASARTRERMNRRGADEARAEAGAVVSLHCHPVGSRKRIMGDPRSPAAVAGTGLVALAVAIGIGRFAFTPILPMMQEDAGVSVAAGGWLAAANYVGYLAGALSVIWWRIGGAAGIRGGLAAGGSPRAGRGGERWR